MAEGSVLSAPFSFQMLHPIVRLLAWGVAVVLVQRLLGVWLALACAALSAIAAWRAGRRFRLLLNRSRWLIGSLLALFALATPGVYLLPALGSLGPTEEGLRLGLEHALRLLALLAALALLLEMTGVEGLLEGLHGLMRPLAWLGLDRGRIALRLLLVLNYVEQAPPGRHWREWLEDTGGDESIGVLHLRRDRLAPLDYAVLAGLTFVMLAFIGTAS